MQSLSAVSLEDLKSRATSQNSPAAPVDILAPDKEAAAILSTIIDLGRGALGWGRLPEREQFAMVCSFYLELCDEGVPRERWMDCYRAAAKRRRRIARDGMQVGALAAGELSVEWQAIRDMHREPDSIKLLTANARWACSRCFGTGFERMPDGSVRRGCQHEQWTEEDDLTLEENEQERRDFTRRQTEVMREALRAAGRPKPAAAEKATAPPGHWLTCGECGRRVNVLYAEEYQRCGELLNRGTHDGELKLCDGVLVAGGGPRSAGREAEKDRPGGRKVRKAA